MNYLLLSPAQDLLGMFTTADIKTAKQVIRTNYEFGTHFTILSSAAIAELKTNVGKRNRKTSTLPFDFDISTIKQIQL